MSRWTHVFTLFIGISIGVGISSFRTPPPPKVNGIVVLATTLNVRDQPSTSAKILTTMKRGDPVRMIKRQGQWTQVIAKPGTAWVYSEFIGSSKDFARTKKALEAKAKKKREEDREKAEKKRILEGLLRREKEKAQRELAYIERYKDWYLEIDKECRARAEFRKTWLGWELYAAGQSKLISEIFPKDKNKIARVLEELGAGDPVHYVTYLRHIKVCK